MVRDLDKGQKDYRRLQMKYSAMIREKSWVLLALLVLLGLFLLLAVSKVDAWDLSFADAHPWLHQRWTEDLMTRMEATGAPLDASYVSCDTLNLTAYGIDVTKPWIDDDSYTVSPDFQQYSVDGEYRWMNDVMLYVVRSRDADNPLMLVHAGWWWDVDVTLANVDAGHYGPLVGHASCGVWLVPETFFEG
jgi:hypothetical protein